MEYIGIQCFTNSALEFLRLLPALRTIEESTFYECKSLRTIYIEDGCGARLSDADIPECT